MDMVDDVPTVRRLGLDWCQEHRMPTVFCCADKPKAKASDEPGDPLSTDDESAEDPTAPEEAAERKPRPKPPQPGGYNALRRYTGLMIRGSTHPFQMAGGPLASIVEGDDAMAAALSQARTERIPLTSLIATGAVTPTHIGLMLRGKAPDVRLGGALDFQEMPTIIRVNDKYNVLADGHHRATAAWASGATHMKMRVLTGVTPTFENGQGLLLQPQV